MITDHLPIYGLRLLTERLELRLPDLEELGRLADVAADGIHRPDFMPFLVPWTDTTPAKRARSSALWYHRCIGNWTAEDWQLPFVVFFGGEPVGIQEVGARRFPICREVETGSWLGLAHQGQGIGTEMRAAVLHFAFAGIGADWATSASFDGNDRSAGVSRRLGYRPDGFEFHVVQDERRLDRRWRLDREGWVAHRRHEVEIEGLDDAVLEMMGLVEQGEVLADAV